MQCKCYVNTYYATLRNNYTMKSLHVFSVYRQIFFNIFNGGWLNLWMRKLDSEDQLYSEYFAIIAIIITAYYRIVTLPE